VILLKSVFQRCISSIILVDFLREEKSKVVLTLCYHKKNDFFFTSLTHHIRE